MSFVYIHVTFNTYIDVHLYIDVRMPLFEPSSAGSAYLAGSGKRKTVREF